MKKLVVFLLISASVHIAAAQETWLFHPSLGVNFTPINNGDVDGATLKTGFNASINFVQRVEEHWSLDYGLSINKRFSSYSSSETSDELSDLLDIGNIPIIGDFDLTIYTDAEVLSSYWTVDLPITASYSFKSGIFLFGGGYVNYLMAVSNEERTTTHIPIFEVINPEDLGFIDPALLPFIPENKVETESSTSKENLNELGFGVIGGFGYQSKTIILKFNYQHGFTDLRSDDIRMNIGSQRTIQLSIGYLFDEIFTTSGDKPRYDLDVIE